MVEPTCGVYCWRCRATGKVYVGSSIDIEDRYLAHIGLLRSGRHHSKRFQRAWNKYGESNFAFALVEECDLANLRKCESSWIEYYNSYYEGYNGTTNTGQGTTIPLEVRTKMAKGCKRAGVNPELRRIRSERAKAQHKAGRLGQSCWAPGTSKIVGDKLRGRKRPDVAIAMKGNKHWRGKSE